MPSIFNFVTKEGKHFAPISQKTAKYKIEDGVIIEDGSKISSGAKGTFAKVRIQIGESSAGEQAELFSVNTEFFPSSN